MSEEDKLSEAQAVLTELVDTGDSLLNRTSYVSAQNGLVRWLRSVERALDGLDGGDVLVAEWNALPSPDLEACDRGEAAEVLWATLQNAIHARLRWLWSTIRVLEEPPEPPPIEEEEVFRSVVEPRSASDDESFDDFFDEDESDDNDTARTSPAAAPAAKTTPPPARAADRPARAEPAPESANRSAVVIIHGRDTRARDAIADFSRALGLEPLGWYEAVAASGRLMPSADEVIERAFALAQAVVVVMTGDDEAKLRDAFVEDTDPPHESQLTAQARPEMLFLAGLALGRASARTVIVEIGTLRPFAHSCNCPVVRLDDSSQRRFEFYKRLESAGCVLNIRDKSWHTAGNFNAAA